MVREGDSGSKIRVGVKEGEVLPKMGKEAEVGKGLSNKMQMLGLRDPRRCRGRVRGKERGRVVSKTQCLPQILTSRLKICLGTDNERGQPLPLSWMVRHPSHSHRVALAVRGGLMAMAHRDPPARLILNQVCFPGSKLYVLWPKKVAPTTQKSGWS